MSISTLDMQFPKLNFRKFFSALLTGVFALNAFAQDPVLPKAPPSFKMGMEVELLHDKLANLTVLYDFEKFQNDTQPDRVLNILRQTSNQFKKFIDAKGDISKHYLRNAPSAFRNLPADLQAELSAGLHLKSKVLSEAPKLLGVEDKPVERKSSLLLPDAPKPSSLQGTPQKLILSGSNSAPVKPMAVPPIDSSLFQTSGSLEVPNRMEWEKLYARWEALPEERRNSVVKLDLLGPKEKAAVMYRSIFYNREIPLKASLSEKDRDLFSRLEVLVDGDALEFRHKEPVTSQEQFLSDLRQFAKRAQVENEIFHPDIPRADSFVKNAEGKIVEKAKQWGSFHYHYSLDKDLIEFAEQLNDNMFVRRIEAGIYSDLGTASFGYQNVRDRGVMRLVDKDHIEVRAHHENLLAELDRQFKPIFSKDPAAAALEITNDTRARMSEAVIEKIANSQFYQLLKRYNIPYEKFVLKWEAALAVPEEAHAAATRLLVIKPESQALKKIFEYKMRDSNAVLGTLSGSWAPLTKYWMRMQTPEESAKIHSAVAGTLGYGTPHEVEATLKILNEEQWPAPPSKDVMHELDSFLSRLQRGQAGAQEPELLVEFGRKYFKGNPAILPIYEMLLGNRPDIALRGQIESAILQDFSAHPEIFKSFGAQLVGLREGASKHDIQEAALRNLLFSHKDETQRISYQVLLAEGAIDPAARYDAITWYKRSQKSPKDIELGYVLGQHDQEFRELVLADFHRVSVAGSERWADTAAKLGIAPNHGLAIANDCAALFTDFQ